MPKELTAVPETRLSIRASKNQKSVLARAAANHMNISQFVLGASLREAEKVIGDETRIVLSADEYDWLVKYMDEPPSPKPQLRAALLQKPVWDA